MEQTIDRTGNVVVGTSTTSVTWDVTWNHYDTTNYILESIALRFTMGTSSGYSVKVSENDSGWIQRLNAMDSAANGETVTLALSAGSWENKTSGTLRAFFYKRGSSRAIYTSVQFVLTYRAKATTSTITVVRTMAGDPQTVQITNTDPDVYHKVTWTYHSYDGHDVTSGELTYAAATRNPAWAVPAASLEWLYRYNDSSATEAGSVTVKTYAADGTYIGQAQADAVLDLPETAAVKPVFGTETIAATLDSVALAIYNATGNQYVQGHTTVSLTYPGQGQLGATIASVKVITPDGVQTVQNGTAAVTLLRTAGSYTVRVILTDTRGFTSELEDELFTAMAYTDPAIVSIQVLRTDAQGQEQADGQHAWVEAVAAVTGSTASMSAVIHVAGGAQFGDAVPLVNGTAILPSSGLTLNEDKSYTITVTVTDAYGVTGQASVELGTGTITISRMAGGKGVAFGKKAEKYGVEITAEWPFYTHGQESRRLIVDIAHPAGSSIDTIDSGWDPNEEWPWTRWGQVNGKWVRGV